MEERNTRLERERAKAEQQAEVSETVQIAEADPSRRPTGPPRLSVPTTASRPPLHVDTSISSSSTPGGSRAQAESAMSSGSSSPGCSQASKSITKFDDEASSFARHIQHQPEDRPMTQEDLDLFRQLQEQVGQSSNVPQPERPSKSITKFDDEASSFARHIQHQPEDLPMTQEDLDLFRQLQEQVGQSGDVPQSERPSKSITKFVDEASSFARHIQHQPGDRPMTQEDLDLLRQLQGQVGQSGHVPQPGRPSEAKDEDDDEDEEETSSQPGLESDAGKEVKSPSARVGRPLRVNTTGTDQRKPFLRPHALPDADQAASKSQAADASTAAAPTPATENRQKEHGEKVPPQPTAQDNDVPAPSMAWKKIARWVLLAVMAAVGIALLCRCIAPAGTSGSCQPAEEPRHNPMRSAPSFPDHNASPMDTAQLTQYLNATMARHLAFLSAQKVGVANGRGPPLWEGISETVLDQQCAQLELLNGTIKWLSTLEKAGLVGDTARESTRAEMLMKVGRLGLEPGTDGIGRHVVAEVNAFAVAVLKAVSIWEGSGVVGIQEAGDSKTGVDVFDEDVI